jgi:hypothetical protein
MGGLVKKALEYYFPFKTYMLKYMGNWCNCYKYDVI